MRKKKSFKTLLPATKVRLPLPGTSVIKDTVSTFFDALMSCTDERIVLWTLADAENAFAWAKQTEEILGAFSGAEATVGAERVNAYRQWQREAEGAIRGLVHNRGLKPNSLGLEVGELAEGTECSLLRNACSVLSKAIFRGPYLLDNERAIELVVCASRHSRAATADISAVLGKRVQADSRAAAAASILKTVALSGHKRSRLDAGIDAVSGFSQKRARSLRSVGATRPRWLLSHAHVLSALLLDGECTAIDLRHQVKAVLQGGAFSSPSSLPNSLRSLSDKYGAEVVCLALSLSSAQARDAPPLRIRDFPKEFH